MKPGYNAIVGVHIESSCKQWGRVQGVLVVETLYMTLSTEYAAQFHRIVHSLRSEERLVMEIVYLHCVVVFETSIYASIPS